MTAPALFKAPSRMGTYPPPRPYLPEGEGEHSAALAALNRLPLGVILVDESGRVLTRNRSAEQILQRLDGLRVAEGTLQASDPRETQSLHQLIQRAAEAGSAEWGKHGSHTLSLSRPSGERALEVAVLPISTPESRLRRRGGVAAALFVSDPTRSAQLDVQVLRRLYGLTPAEASFAAQLAQGKTVEEIAGDLGISTHTARGHLKNIFAKTDTHRQASLVRLLLTGPAQLRLDR